VSHLEGRVGRVSICNTYAFDLKELAKRWADYLKHEIFRLLLFCEYQKYSIGLCKHKW